MDRPPPTLSAAALAIALLLLTTAIADASWLATASDEPADGNKSLRVEGLVPDVWPQDQIGPDVTGRWLALCPAEDDFDPYDPLGAGAPSTLEPVEVTVVPNEDPVMLEIYGGSAVEVRAACPSGRQAAAIFRGLEEAARLVVDAAFPRGDDRALYPGRPLEVVLGDRSWLLHLLAASDDAGGLTGARLRIDGGRPGDWQRQTLDLTAHEGEIHYADWITWAGDLDGDTALDLALITDLGDGAVRVRWYHSSAAAPGDLVAEVASIMLGPRC